MKKKTIIQMVVGILFLLTLIISSTYAYFNIVNTSSNNTTSNYNAKLEDIEKYGTSLLTGGEGELHLRVKASDMTPSKIGNKYYATTSEDDYQLRRGNHIVSNATIQKGLSNYEYNCISKLTITLDGTMVSEDGLRVGDAKIYLRGTNNNIKNEEYDLKTLIDELELNDDGKKEYTREIEYLLTSDNEGKVMIDVEFANNNNNQTTSSGKNLNIEITNSELVCGLGNSKVYASLDTSANSYGEKYRSKEYRDKIITASFVDYKPTEEELLTKPIYWDLTDTSKSEKDSVIGWLEEREETDTYDLYIGSNKEIYVSSLSHAFYYMTSLQATKFDNINTSEATDMGYMFYDSKITDLDISNFDTSKVTTMSHMFYNCSNLTNLDLSNFDTSNVTNMSHMFADLNGITSINQIKGFKELDTSSVTDMSNMFYYSKITDLDISHFDTSNVKFMSYMFYMCRNLTNLNLSSFDTSSVTNMSSMFASCSNLTSLDLSNFDTSSVTNMQAMFDGCSNLTELDISHFNTSSVTNMSKMFYECRNLTSLDLSHFDTSNVTDMSDMFNMNGNGNLKNLNLSSFKTSKVTNMHNMFRGLAVKSLEDIKGLYEFDTSKVTNIGGIFSSCKNVTEIDLTKFELDSVTNMSYMFADLNGITSINQIKGFKELDTSKVTNMSAMFENSKIKDLDLSHFDTSNVTNMSWMFSSFEDDTLDLSHFETSKVTDMSYMFYFSRINDLDLSGFDTSKVTNMNSMFGYLNNITSISQIKGFEELNTSSVTTMGNMFNSYKGTTLDLSSFDTSKVTNMSGMFQSCTNLKELKLNKATFDKVTSYSNMFGYKSGNNSNRVPNDIHLTIKKGQETFINDRLNDAYPEGHNAKIDLVD